MCEPTSRGLNSAVKVLRAPPDIFTGRFVVGPGQELSKNIRADVQVELMFNPSLAFFFKERDMLL